MAHLVGLTPSEVQELERGAVDVPYAVLERYATIFGTRPSKFLAGAGAKAPATLLFRSAAESGVELGKVLEPDGVRVLGEFLRAVSDLDELRRRLAEPAAVIPQFRAADLQEPVWQQGQAFAEQVRDAFGLGDEPIVSMKGLLEDRLGWSLFFVTPEELPNTIQGASTIDPCPAILVNLIEGERYWWSTRMSLAHEMCHVLFDSRTRSRPYLISPQGDLQGRRDWAIVDRFRGIERRANAFAVHLLAPGAGIRRIVGRSSPDSNDAIDAVCGTFGIGRTVAIRRLGHEYGLSEDAQMRMLEHGDWTLHASSHPDGEVTIGLRNGRLVGLVERALATGVIGAVAARAILGISLSEALPFSGSEREPLLDPEHVAKAVAETHLRSRGEQGCWSTTARATDNGWEVVVQCPRSRGPVEQTVRLTSTFEPLPA